MRKNVLARRDAMDPESRNAFSQEIVREITGLEIYGDSGAVLAYAGFGSELRTDEFLSLTLDLGKTLMLPRVNRETKSLDLYTVGDLSRDLIAGTWGIREPNPDLCAPSNIRDVDLVLVPGVAFDARGGRLGYGAGFYDGLLSGRASHTHLVAGAFEVQMVELVPMGSHDVPVDLVVTEEGRYPS